MFQQIQNKIKDWESAVVQVQQWKDEGQSIVFTNGCFDILHLGHIQYLAEAKNLGNRLIIGLNSDASVQRLKGTHRPIKDAATRSHLLAALEMVDMVVFFKQDTPLELINLLLPNILVKGGDYQANDIVGYDIITKNGGEVKVLPFLEGYSTTAIEQKVKGT